MSDEIVFEVETTRILKILASEIYDSPLALLRENVQNAYDAVRMRFVPLDRPLSDGRIDVTVENGIVAIVDNGVGMTETVLRENFWKAGSSGKHSTEARQAGVVGTFGIGAMANFGVCTQLIVRTRTEGAAETLTSSAERDKLKISTPCITLNRSSDEAPVGTAVTAVLDSENVISADQAMRYLSPYVSLLPVPVYLNGTLISGKTMESQLPLPGRTFSPIGIPKTYRSGDLSASYQVSVDANGQVLVRAADVVFSGSPIAGQLMLVQSGGQLMGLRSSFGLAPVPSSGYFQFGGFADLSFLQPTAGREAVSRDSIAQVGNLVKAAEMAAAEAIATESLADKNTGFMQWVYATGRIDLADRVTVRLMPDGVDVPLAAVKSQAGERTTHYYLGTDSQTINLFAGEGSCLLCVAQGNPRRELQRRYLVEKLQLEAVPDSAKVIRIYKGRELDASEAAVVIRVSHVLREDYLIPNVEACFADISHGVKVLPLQQGEELLVYLERSSAVLQSLKQIHRDEYSLFTSFIKDFVRTHIFPAVQQFVPSSTRQGVDNLRKMLERNRELYRYEEEESYPLESVMGDYLSGSATMGQVLTAVRAASSIQAQRVSESQVSNAEYILRDVVASPVPQAPNEGAEYAAAPPILREEIDDSDIKIIMAGKKYPQLNNFSMLLGLSDRLMRISGDFFRTPHTTRIIWGGHRVIYIFAEGTGRLSLYYDIELREPLDGGLASGGMFRTTTLITRRRIFVPVPDPLVDAFKIVSGPREFYVRFDTLYAGE